MNTIPGDWRTSDATKDTGNNDEANEGDAAKIPDWSNSLKSRMIAMVQRKIFGVVPPGRD